MPHQASGGRRTPAPPADRSAHRPLKSVSLRVCRTVSLDVRPHQLVADEQEDDDTSGDQQLANHSDRATGRVHSTTLAYWAASVPS